MTVTVFAAANITVNVIFSMLGRMVEDGTGLVWLGYLMSLIFKPAFYVLNAYLVNRFSFRRFTSFPISAMVIYGLTVLVIIGAAISFNSRSTFMDETVLNMVANLITYFMVALMYAFFYLICYYYKGEMDSTYEAQRATARSEELMIQARSTEELRRIRHDIKNRYTYMDLLIKEKRYDDLDAYFGEMREALDEGMSYIDTGNGALNTMLNMEQGKALQAGTSLDCDVSVPEKIEISEMDLSAVLINAIDNAVEACKRYSVTDPVKVSVKEDGNFLYVRVANVLPADADTERILSMATSKKDRDSHGIGHGTIEKICGRHGGACEFSVTDGEFVTDAVLTLDGGER